MTTGPQCGARAIAVGMRSRADRLERLMSKKTSKRKARLRRSKANHGKRPNMGR